MRPEGPIQLSSADSLRMSALSNSTPFMETAPTPVARGRGPQKVGPCASRADREEAAGLTPIRKPLRIGFLAKLLVIRNGLAAMHRLRALEMYSKTGTIRRSRGL
jgi:hypothetical protein